MNRGGFSWKRALGITKAKQRISRKTGIPLTKSGRQRKIGKAVTSGCGCSGCMVSLIGMVGLVVFVGVVIVTHLL